MKDVPVQDGLVIGVDIGGTKVAAGLVDSTGEILAQTRTPMVSSSEAAAGLGTVTAAIESGCAKSAINANNHGLIRCIGICSPRSLDSKDGVVINHPNLPRCRN